MDRTWLEVDANGKVYFKDVADSVNKRATVIATPNDGGPNLIYIINIHYWFEEGTNYPETWQVAKKACESNKFGYILPSYRLLTSARAAGEIHKSRDIGTLLGEWGKVTDHYGRWKTYTTWTVEQHSDTEHYTVGLFNGSLRSTSLPTFFMCSRAL